MKLSVIKLAEEIGVARQQVDQWCRDQWLIRQDRKVDMSLPENIDFLRSRGYTSVNIPGLTPNASARDRALPPLPPLDDPESSPDAPDEDNIDLSGIDAETLLEKISSLSLRELSHADVQKIQRLESAMKTRVERENKRGLLIERSLVSTVFGRLYQIDSNELRPLGARLAPLLAAVAATDDPAVILRFEQIIEDECNKVLSHIKRTLDDFLRKMGAEPAL